MKFQVGDEVRIIKFPDRYYIGCTCVVTDTQQYCDFCCTVKQVSTGWECLMRAGEIEPVIRIGDQLLLFEL